MSNLEYNDLNILEINYSDTTKLKKYTSEQYKHKFNWKQYIKFYSDLKINNFDGAWKHWVKHGMSEKRNFFLHKNKNTTPINTNTTNINTTNPNPNKNVIFSLTEPNTPTSNSNNINQNGTNVDDIIIKHNNSKIGTKKNTGVSLKKILDKSSYENINFKIRLLRKNNLIYKNIYDNYGLHYYGWKEVINHFIKNYEKNTVFNQQFFFDEWLEKFLVWGDKQEKNFYLKEIYSNNYKIISFIHNPPFQKWYNKDYRTNIKNKIIYNDEHTNKNLIKNIDDYELEDKIVYLYTLTNYHKEYIYNKCPEFKNKLLSLHHPIELNAHDNLFDFSLFCQNKQIIHIGWWLRNFKTFIDFKQPKEYHKTILIKNDFENEWNNISTSYKLDNITIVKELSNTEYEKIFTNSCIFIDLEDSSATNTVIECIKFNTPIIIRKIPSVVEYLGEKYPLYFETNDDLNLFNNPNYLLKMISKANEYISKMNKTHIELQTFNSKINYDLNKLDENENNMLTWFCFINDLNDIDRKLLNLYNNFISQNDNSKLKLHIVICDTISLHEKYSDFLEKIQKYSELVYNISYSTQKIDGYNDFLDLSSEICNTEYLVIIDIEDQHTKRYSCIFINFLNNNPTCDVIFSSYKITTHCEYSEDFIFKKSTMLFNSNYNSIVLPETGMVWRKNMSKLVGKFIHLKNKKYILREYWYRTISKNFNIVCCENDILYTCKVF
jgi:hypothetical protein